ncbi:transmembrane protein 216-like [Pocillopora damicornis]|uniref:transmembrane protein 216-like n=1 Tax=Pocillopora damicornis TaxID=46731 RepID=UPI000F5565A7|nr:transmembrane protein 216-like [Pocillopora damicornis]
MICRDVFTFCCYTNESKSLCQVSGYLHKETNMAGDNRGKTVMELSSLPLQIFLFLNIWYAMVFCVAELLLYVYKGTFTEVLTRVAGLLFLTFSLRIEVVLVSVALAFLGFEMIFSFAAIFTFKRHQTMLR